MIAKGMIRPWQIALPQFPIPRREEIVDNMLGGHCFTSMDLRDGYYQMHLKAEQRHLTAFIE